MNCKQLLTLTALIALTISLTWLNRRVPAASADYVEAAAAWPDAAATLAALTSAWEFLGDATGDELGYSVSSAGDVNGDGYSEVIIGAAKDTIEIYRAGAAYLFNGSAAGLSLNPTWTAAGAASGVRFGAAVAGAGDINNDGYADVIIGASEYKNEQTKVGAAYVYYGSTGGLGDTPGWSFVGEQQDSNLGVAVGTAGDINGDGYADVIIGAKWYSHDQPNEGRAYVFHGSAAGLSDTPAWLAEIDQAVAAFGSAVATAGDVNGDGYADVVVGAPEYDDQQQDEGAVFLFYGSATGLNSAPDLTLSGGQAGARFGAAVNPAGDVNQDGYSDVIIGAPLFDTNQTDTGAAFLFLGSAMGLTPTAQRTLDIGQNGSGFGGAVSPAGDVNGDGYADVVVGAEFYTNDNSQEGGAFLFLGSAAGLGSTVAWQSEGDKAETQFGHAVSTAGDVNGDGYADVVVGAPTYRIQTDLRGKAFLFHGVEPSSEADFRVFLPVVLKN